MGSSSWDSGAWRSYASTVKTKTASAIYTSRTMDPDLDPKNIKLRESCDSDAHPASTPLILGLDVTGSMDPVLEVAVKKFGTLMEEIIDRTPITDPQIMSMGIGDVTCDDAPLQVTQFETDLLCVDQLAKVYLERGGGGNNSESYFLPWYFAATRTNCDSMIKRNKKGYLFTVGDEQPPHTLNVNEIERVFGDAAQANLSIEELLTMVERSWNVFHIIVKQGNHIRYHGLDSVVQPWRKLLGQRVIILDDINALPEVVVSTIQVNEGEDKSKVASSWSGTTAVAVSNAISNLPAGTKVTDDLVVL